MGTVKLYLASLVYLFMDFFFFSGALGPLLWTIGLSQSYSHLWVVLKIIVSVGSWRLETPILFYCLCHSTRLMLIHYLYLLVVYRRKKGGVLTQNNVY